MYIYREFFYPEAELNHKSRMYSSKTVFEENREQAVKILIGTCFLVPSSLCSIFPKLDIRR